jgi:hypothetical protein
MVVCNKFDQNPHFSIPRIHIFNLIWWCVMGKYSFRLLFDLKLPIKTNLYLICMQVICNIKY